MGLFLEDEQEFVKGWREASGSLHGWLAPLPAASSPSAY